MEIDKENVEFPNQIELDVEDEYKAIYRNHYKTIYTRVSKGRLRTMYHFLITGDYSRKNTYKINVAFGFILGIIAKINRSSSSVAKLNAI